MKGAWASGAAAERRRARVRVGKWLAYILALRAPNTAREKACWEWRPAMWKRREREKVPSGAVSSAGMVRYNGLGSSASGAKVGREMMSGKMAAAERRMALAEEGQLAVAVRCGLRKGSVRRVRGGEGVCDGGEDGSGG